MRDAVLKRRYILLAVAAVVALFAQTAAFSFIGIDDAAYTFRNPFVAGGLSVPNIVEAFANLRHGGIWMPITYITYMCDASFCGLSGIPLVGWMHLSNVFLHAVNLLLLYRLLTALDRDGAVPRPQLLIVALLWAVHPLRTEPVAWIAARKELLWSLFAISGLLFWIASELSPSTSRRSVLVAYLFCALACLSKPTAMCFPFLAFLVEWCLRGRTIFRVQESRPLKYVPLLLMACITAAIAAYSQTHVAGQSASSLYSAPFPHRFINALSAMGFYVKSTFWPLGLHIDCRAANGLWPLDAMWNLGVLALFALVASWAVANAALAKGGTSPAHGRISFAVGWFVVSVFPTLGLLGSFGFEAHADRFAYLPTMAFAFILAALPFGRKNHVAAKIFVAVLVLLSAVTYQQLGFWRDDGTAYRRTLALDPDHPRAMVHVADATCSRKRDFDQGIKLYRKALSCFGNVPRGGFDVADVKARLAYALASRGRHEDFSEIRKLGSDVLRDFGLDRRGMMLDALGTAFMYDGEWKRAILLFQASIDAPDRFWPKVSTKRKLDECKERMP